MGRAADKPSEDFSFHVVRYGDRHELEVRQPALYSYLGDSFFQRHGENPDTRESTPCFFCLLDAANKVVSSIYGSADTLTIDGKEYPWIWTGALQTVEHQRGKGLASRVQHEGTQFVRTQGIGRGSVFSTDVTLHIYQKLGYCQPGFVPRYISLRSTRPLVRGHIENAWGRTLAYGVSQPLLMCSNVARRLFNKLRRRGADFGEAVSTQHEHVQSVIQRMSAARKVHFNMGVEKLAWKIATSQRRGGRVLIYVLWSRPSVPVGYAVVRTRRETTPLAERYRDFECMALMDYGLVEETDALYAALLSNLVELFHQSEAEVLDVVCGGRLTRRMALRYGLVPAGKGMSFSFCVPASWHIPGVDLLQMSTWHVNHFSGDGATI